MELELVLVQGFEEIGVELEHFADGDFQVGTRVTNVKGKNRFKRRK